jgi:hypothetical protein
MIGSFRAQRPTKNPNRHMANEQASVRTVHAKTGMARHPFFNFSAAVFL